MLSSNKHIQTSYGWRTCFSLYWNKCMQSIRSHWPVCSRQ